MNRQDARHDTHALDHRIENGRHGAVPRDASRERRAAPGHAVHGLVALAVVPLLFAVNALANHVVPIPGGRLGYSLVVIFGAGTVLPAVALAWLAARGTAACRLPGAGWSELPRVLGALAAAALIAAFPIGGDVLEAPGRALHLLVWLFPSSLAEVLVFLGVLHGVLRAWLGRVLPGWAAIGIAALAGSVVFGVHHFTYYPPWNTGAVALKLTIVWLEVSAVYVITRSLWAAAAFNTVMAVIGFILNDVRRLDGEPLALGLGLGALGVATVVLLTRAARR
jgi:hypothetical protein